jgi:signal transduction histidine kinase/streptogramin lyase
MSFYEDSAGTFWIFHASGTGLAVFDRKTRTLTHVVLSGSGASSLSQVAVYSILEDHEGTLWLGGEAGLLRYNRSSKTFTRYRHYFGDEGSLSGNYVVALYEDREGNIWIALHGTELNLLMRRRLPFEILPRSPGSKRAESERMVNGIYEDNEGALWISYVGALATIDRNTGKKSLQDLSAGNITADVVPMIEGHAQVMWLGTIGEGLVQLDKKTNKLRNYRHNPKDSSSLSNDVVERLMFDSKGALWAATWDGLNRFDAATGRFTNFKVDEQQNRSQFYLDIKEDQQGIFWLGSNYSGLHRFDPTSGRFTVYEHSPGRPDSLSNNRVNSVHIDHSGMIWLGTQNGLDRFDSKTGRFARYFEKDGLGGNVVSCILEDEHGALWMSTNKGISRFDPVHEAFSSYSRNDGLPGVDLTGWGACFRSRRGELLFGGYSGATAFFPKLPTDNDDNYYAPPTVFTAFELSGISVGIGGDSPLRQSISHTSDLTLNHADNTFSIEFSALSFSSPTTNRYRYKLDGLDSNWHAVGSDRRIASYTTLAPGRYTFRVQGATSRGSWSEPGALLRITILPPWWSTWWFRSIMAGLVALAAICIYYYRVRRIARQLEIRFEERLGERTRIARELHDSLLQGFQALIVHLQAIRDMLPGRGAEAAQALERALDRGDKAIEEGRLAVQSLRFESDGGEDLTEALRDLESELTSHSGGRESPAYRLVTEGKPHTLDPIMRDEVYGIVREAFRNAVRHANASNIEVEVAFGERRFCLRIRDDGVGLDPHVLSEGNRPGHWGLPGMRERAQRLGGVLNVWSTHGAGTEVELIVPATIAYGKGSVRYRFWRGPTTN